MSSYCGRGGVRSSFISNNLFLGHPVDSISSVYEGLIDIFKPENVVKLRSLAVSLADQLRLSRLHFFQVFIINDLCGC